MQFEFDRRKSWFNKRKHGVSLQEAMAIWQETHAEGQARTIDEPREMAIGPIQGKLYACIYTRRGDVIRLISCRRARPKEVALYHEHIKTDIRKD